MDIKFPKKFLWGSASSAHQVEGNNLNDWTSWEIKTAERRASKAKSKKWPKFIIDKYPSPLMPENYISGKACNHYELFEEDFDIAKKLNQNAHRLSIEWSRIEPKEGVFDEKEINHYRQVVSALRQRGIEPFVTLWHWPIPLWLREKGGWESKETINYFCRYAEKMSSVFKDDVKFWITINEPRIYAARSYLEAAWPPQKVNLFSFFRVLTNLAKAHKEAYKIIKKMSPESKVGLADNIAYFEPYHNNIVNILIKKIVDNCWEFSFLKKTITHQDFIGLNHYFHYHVDFFFRGKKDKISDTDWDLWPLAIYQVLKQLKKYNKPIYITENGLADIKDEKRSWFIHEYLKNVAKAMQEGIDVRGYFYWSLTDNFEWEKGFWPRFGLIEINYKNMERKIRPSAYEYAQICKNNSLDINT